MLELLPHEQRRRTVSPGVLSASAPLLCGALQIPLPVTLKLMWQRMTPGR